MFTSKLDIDIKPLPDKILTVGKENKKIIENYSNYKDNFVIDSCPLRFPKKIIKKSNNKNKINNLLVVLEGIPETIKMINYIIKFINNYSNYKIIYGSNNAK